jgi:uncharacterized membrane protein YkvA (DUF1232 family)
MILGRSSIRHDVSSIAARIVEGQAACPKDTMREPLNRLKIWARALKRDVLALWIAARDSRTPWCAKAVAACVAAYALSPIDLIPDFIPVLGYLDDLLIVPLGIALAVRLIPPELMVDFRRDAALQASKPRSYGAALVIVAIWLIALAVAAYGLFQMSGRAS